VWPPPPQTTLPPAPPPALHQAPGAVETALPPLQSPDAAAAGWVLVTLSPCHVPAAAAAAADDDDDDDEHPKWL
jgi:hypothetical protein